MRASKERGTDPTAGECLIVEWALALPLTTAFADGYTSAPVKARPLSTNETMEFRLWSSACLHEALSGRARKSPSFASNSMYADSKLELKQIPHPFSSKLPQTLLYSVAYPAYFLSFSIFLEITLNFFPPISYLSSFRHFEIRKYRVTKHSIEMYNLFTPKRRMEKERQIRRKLIEIITCIYIAKYNFFLPSREIRAI